MRGVKLVISTLIIIFILSISCYSALAYDPLDTAGSGATIKPGGRAIGGSGTVSVQSTGGPTQAIFMYMDAGGNVVGSECAFLPGQGAAYTTGTPPGADSTNVITNNPSNPLCSSMCADAGMQSYTTTLFNSQLNGCMDGEIVGTMYTHNDQGMNGAANMFAGPDFYVLETVVPPIETVYVWNEGTDTWTIDSTETLDFDVVLTGYDTTQLWSIDSMDSDPWSGDYCDPNPQTTITDTISFDGSAVPLGTIVTATMDVTNDFGPCPFMSPVNYVTTTIDFVAETPVGPVTATIDDVVSGDTILLPVSSMGIVGNAMVMDNGNALQYVVPTEPETEIHIVNIDIVPTIIDITCFDFDCEYVTEESGIVLNPGAKYISTICTNSEGSAFIESSDAPVGVMIREEVAEGLALFNIFGGEDPEEIFDTIQWATAPSGDFRADIYLINPTDTEALSTLEVYRNGKQIDIYAEEIEPYCVKKIEVGDLDEIYPTEFKMSYSESGIPSPEIPGNAVLKIYGNNLGGLSVQNTGTGYGAVSAYDQSDKEGPPIEEGQVYVAPFFEDCQMSSFYDDGPIIVIGDYTTTPYTPPPEGQTKTTSNGFSNNNNGNKVDVTQQIFLPTPYGPTVIWEPIPDPVPFPEEYLPDFESNPIRVEPFSVVEITPESVGYDSGSLLLDIGSCGGQLMSLTADPDFVMSAVGTNFETMDTLFTTTYMDGNVVDIDLSYKTPAEVYSYVPPEECNPPCEEWQTCFEGYCVGVLPIETCDPPCEEWQVCEFERCTGTIPIDPGLLDIQDKQYGITGQATNTENGKPNYILLLVILGIIVGIVFLMKTYKPRKK